MAVQLDVDVVNLFQDAATVKVLATVDQRGIPHVVVKQTLQVDGAGNLVYLELLESSQTNKNLLRSLWFNRPVAVTIKGGDNQSYQITGQPVKALVAGPVFQEHYVNIRKKLGDVDLATVWLIQPEAVRNQTFSVRQAQEQQAHPNFIHLDQLAKPDYTNQQKERIHR